jgi:putative OPT family oligopeptide transporter
MATDQPTDGADSRPGDGGPAEFAPYIPAQAKLRELTVLPLVTGVLLGIVFGASSLYLVLKVGMTVSASIPIAVLSITLFRVLSKLGLRDATILENNIVQTAGSAGESIAGGIGMTMPAILILGFDLELTRVMLVSLLGGLLGVLMMIPLRRALIVRQHGVLKYPEGTACAEILMAGASRESRAAAGQGRGALAGTGLAAATKTGGRTVFTGFGIGAAYMTIMQILKGWKDISQKIFSAPFNGASVSMEVSPALLGVGYIIGPRIAGVMCAGGALSYLVLIPAIKFFGEKMTGVVSPGTIPIAEMGPNQVRGAYVLYVGAGAVASAGILALIRSLPIIWHSLKRGLGDLRGSARPAAAARTGRDLSMKFVIAGIVLLTAAILAFRSLQMNFLGAAMIILCGFLFVTVSSRVVGEIGSSPNPISGMTVATLLATCLIFLLVGWTGPTYYVTALSVGAIVCIAAANAGATSQDLKTGYLVGATPRLQQIAILVGAVTSALVIGLILLRLNESSTVYVPRVTFEPVAPGAPALDAQTLGTLPAYAEDVRPPGPGVFRVLTNRSSGPSPVMPALGPGQFLVDDSGRIVCRLSHNFSAGLGAGASQLGPAENLKGPQAAGDGKSYRVWHKADNEGGPAGRYLVDEQGAAVYLVDPGINGVHNTRPDGSTVAKYDSPKATLMSYIIKGILSRELPWGLVLLGVMITVVLELAGVPSLPFAVGVYLPLSTSSPILVGGLVRRLVERGIRRRPGGAALSAGAAAAEADKGPGVLLASGYVAGGAIAGIAIAFMAGVLGDLDKTLDKWSAANNPAFGGAWADLLSLAPFAVLAFLLLLVGRRMITFERPAAAGDASGGPATGR